MRGPNERSQNAPSLQQKLLVLQDNLNALPEHQTSERLDFSAVLASRPYPKAGRCDWAWTSYFLDKRLFFSLLDGQTMFGDFKPPKRKKVARSLKSVCWYEGMPR